MPLTDRERKQVNEALESIEKVEQEIGGLLADSAAMMAMHRDIVRAQHLMRLLLRRRIGYYAAE